MALPSGTTISAADINSYLGRSSGTAVDWNTTVRTLSNTTTATPDLNGTRGRYSRGIFNSTSPSTDVWSSQTNWNAIFTAAFNIPSSPWRLVARGYPYNVGGGGNALELTVVGSGLKVYNVYSLTGASPMPVGHPTNTVYPGADWNMAMLANGKFVIAYSLANTAGQWFGWYGLGFTILTFNANGTIATTNSYYTKLASTMTNTMGNDAYLLYNRRENREMSTFGNKCSFALNTNGNKWLTITLDGTNTNPSIQYTLVSNNDTGNVATGGSVNATADRGGITPIVYYDGSMSVIRAPSTGSEPVLNSKLNAAGNAWANPGTRWGADSTYTNSPLAYVPSSNYPSTGYGIGLSLVAQGWQNVYHDCSLAHSYRNYYVVREYALTTSNMQVQGSPYSTALYSGSLSGILIQKINATDNTIKYSQGIAMRGQYIYITTSTKGGTTTNYYSYIAINGRSLIAVRTDSSDNTYYLIKVTYAGSGGVMSSAPNNTSYGGSVPGEYGSLVTLYTLVKIGPAGAILWQKSFDLGAYSAGRSSFLSIGGSPWGGDLADTRATFSILLREEINEVEIYATYGAWTSGSNPWNVDSNKFIARAAAFNTADGAPTSVISAANASNTLGTLNTGGYGISGSSVYILNSSSTNELVTIYPLMLSYRSNISVYSSSTNYTSSSTWTETLTSASSASVFTANPTVATTGLGIYERYTD